jgi:hypothetical protein
MRKAIAFLVLLFALSARAGTSFSTDYSDLWFNPAESGWGVNVTQQQEIVFATLFHYGTSGQPTWYVGSEIRFVSNVGGVYTFSGLWYQTTGPYLGGAFNPNAVTVRQVGTVTFVFNTVTSGTLTFTADGVTFSKPIQRQTWRTNDPTGNYLLTTAGTFTGCGSGSGPLEAISYYAVTQSGGAITLTESGGTDSCTYTGTYSQFGRLGAANGGFTCTDLPNIAGTFSISEIETSNIAFAARITSQRGSCRLDARMSGTRRN